MARVFATADIGSNTVHLLIAEAENGRAIRIENQSEWLALGEAVARTGEIPLDRADLLVQMLRDHEITALRCKAERLYVFATEAMRASKNGVKVIKRIRAETGIEVDIISPRREAELSLKGVTMDAPSQLGMLLEVGGGSAQIAICVNKTIEAEYSLPIGTGRLQADLRLTQPTTPECVSDLHDTVLQSLSKIPKHEIARTTVASGGIARGLWRALHPDGDQVIALQEIEFLEWTCAPLSRDQIGRRFGVKSKRAAAMLPGAVVYGAVLRHFGATEMFVSEYGVREGAILEMAG
jgi:exopolyphosphatase/guanosine-5'-triphosphate,3'-diphosphate pyrophosphatase